MYINMYVQRFHIFREQRRKIKAMNDTANRSKMFQQVNWSKGYIGTCCLFYVCKLKFEIIFQNNWRKEKERYGSPGPQGKV